MLCAVFRLARYNVLSDDQIPTKIFFGFPTTLTGGLIAIWFLLFLKYDPTHAQRTFGGAKLFGDSLQTPLGVWKYFPIALVVGGYLMASRLPMPKVGMTKNKLDQRLPAASSSSPATSAASRCTTRRSASGCRRSGA